MRTSFGLLTSALLLLSQSTAYAWNSPGHRTVAVIAYRQLDDQTKQRVLTLLEKHPAAHNPLWTDRATNNPNEEGVNAFINAATFPDDARSPSSIFHSFSEPPHHFVDFRYTPPSQAMGLPPDDEENLLTSFQENVAKVQDTNAEDAERAVALSWIFHQVGDVHQPLHCVSRFSTAFPNGDRGGNRVSPFPNPRGSHNLHSYWDDIHGNDHQVSDFAKLNDLANSIMQEYPTDSMDALIHGTDIGVWTKESFKLAVKLAYRDLDPSITSFHDLPTTYAKDSSNAARRQVALAGYRLANQLKALFNAPSNP